MPLEAMRADVTPAGMHYVLIHYDVPFLDADSHVLTLEGFDRPLSLGIDDLGAREAVTAQVTFECAGNGRALFDTRPVSQPWLLEAVGTAEWTGTPLAAALREAGVPDGTVGPGSPPPTGRGRRRGANLRTEPPPGVRRCEEVLLVYGMNGVPCCRSTGAARLLVPGWYGMANVKWLTRITALAVRGLSERRQPSAPQRSRRAGGAGVSRMRVRSLMVPPGIPSFPERERTLTAGLVTLEGRAGRSGSIERVEVSSDGGVTWQDATVHRAADHAWHRWTYPWSATHGVYELACRATDATGATQPLRPEPNVGGYANNAVHRAGPRHGLTGRLSLVSRCSRAWAPERSPSRPRGRRPRLRLSPRLARRAPASSMSVGTSALSRSLPSTWNTIVTVSSTTAPGSYAGQDEVCTDVLAEVGPPPALGGEANAPAAARARAAPRRLAAARPTASRS